MGFDVDMLRDWVDKLCRIEDDTDTVLAALGLDGPRGDDPGHYDLEWPWPNVRYAWISQFDGTVKSIVLHLHDSWIALDDLESLGPKGEFTWNHPPHIRLDWQSFEVEVPGAPFRCTVSAGFEPTMPTFSRMPFEAILKGHDELRFVPRIALEVEIRRHRFYLPGEPRPGMAGMVDLLGRWSERLCVIPSNDAAEVAAALGIAGTVGERGDVEPPPPGMRRLRLLSRWEGSTFNIDVDLLDSTITAADLEARFGPGQQGPRLHVFNDFTLHYERVTGPDPAVTCRVHASFSDEPVATAVTHSVSLSRYRSANVKPAQSPTPRPVPARSDVAVDPATHPSPVTDAPAAAGAVTAAPRYHGALTLRELLADLIGQASTSMPSAKALCDRYLPSAKGVSTAGPNLDHPAWATTINGADDTFFELGDEVIGLQLWEDRRGWGAYAELAIATGTLADVEAVVGPTKSVPPGPHDFHSGPTLAAYLPRGDEMIIRVFIELAKQGTNVRRVTIHFEH